jgi:ATP-GRASP peptide maturase of grasp-with-spasm system
MVLILSENNDLSTDKVIEWLYFWEVKDIIRINEDDKIFIKAIDVQKNTVILLFNNREINLSDIDFFWFRRGNLNHFIYKQIQFENVRLSKNVNDYLNYEWLMCRNYIFHNLQQKKSLGNFFRSATNKLINLRMAKECGLEIPETFISTFASDLINFQNQFSVITKPVGEAMPVYQDSGHYKMLTTSVEKDQCINQCSTYICPVLFQEKIEKQFEIRVFVMYEEIYAMAIFSQKNTKTNVDYRNYDHEKTNRMIPYYLPMEVQQKILHFMKRIDLDTGSIDMIKTPDNRYIFLEVNPAGNIEMVSVKCNYNIEKKIAKMIKDAI